ncbi:hypothetical protein ACFWAY_49025 [Rhodococcus sp. NPDC059968]|uniref:hypothetical protein n=1 Tax=Rhodococcus sp. NPDC059968 TaxID=3347017 RepID=UPI00366C1E8A
MPESFEAELVGGDNNRGNVQIEKITARDLNRSHIGKFIGGNRDGYNYPIRINDVVPKIDEPYGVLISVSHPKLPTQPAHDEKVFVPLDQEIELVSGDVIQ